MEPTCRARYTRKCPYRGPSVLAHWDPRCVHLVDFQYAPPWGRPGAGPNRRLVRFGHCIAYSMEQPENVWDPTGT
jgi:hypothetical protein